MTNSSDPDHLANLSGSTLFPKAGYIRDRSRSRVKIISSMNRIESCLWMCRLTRIYKGVLKTVYFWFSAEEQMMNQNTILIMVVVGLAVVVFLIILYCFQQRQRQHSRTLGKNNCRMLVEFTLSIWTAYNNALPYLS